MRHGQSKELEEMVVCGPQLLCQGEKEERLNKKSPSWNARSSALLLVLLPGEFVWNPTNDRIVCQRLDEVHLARFLRTAFISSPVK